MIALDTETTGLDFFHGCRPFFVSVCDEEGNQRHWEWDVDPFTREVTALQEDLDEIWGLVEREDRIVGQNIRFDVHGLARLDARFKRWPWEKTDDTLIMAHVLDSAALKDLTTLCLRFLDADIRDNERRLKDAVTKARAICRRKDFVETEGEWRTASEEDQSLPTAGPGCDYWLPKALHDRFDWVREEHPDWGTVLSEYGNVDTAVLPPLEGRMAVDLAENDWVAQYRSRMEILPVLWQMEEDGITVNARNLDRLMVEYRKTTAKAAGELLAIAKKYDYDLKLPKGASPNASLRTFLLNVLKVPPIYSRKSKTDAPTLDKNAMAAYLANLPEGDALSFVQSLAKKRKKDTSISYMESYKSYWIDTKDEHIKRIYQSINPVGTDVTRRSCSHPNGQQISKLKDEEGLSLRYAFGPAPGREWWSMDYENIELRIPAYDAGEQAMIDLFERADDPPYFGSNHLLAAHVLWPAEFEECVRNGESFKDKYKDTLYQWTKNGNFAVQYGAMKESGTADRAYHQQGAQAKIETRLGKIADLNRRTIAYAERHGFVYTMADKTVDSEKGYPVSCLRDERGRVRPTTPLSYKVQGTAGWCTGKALIRTSRQIEEWNNERGRRDFWIVAEVHDELVFDFPSGGRKNVGRVRKLRELMVQSGDDIGVPLKVSVSFHPNNWAEEVEIEL